MAYTRICYNCGKEYEYCSRCARFSKQPTWMRLWCSDECHDVFNKLGEYNTGSATKEELKEVLDKYNVKGFTKYSEQINNELKAALGEKKEIPKKVLKQAE